MPTPDFSHLSRQERLDLIGSLCESLEDDGVPLTAAQQAELERRAATLDRDAAQARSADDVLADARQRFR